MYLTTKKGYGFFEVSSAFQKSIRRGDEPVALYFMVELFNSGYDEYLWKRIKVITSEDVGLAEPRMPEVIAGLYQTYSEQKADKKDNRPERMYLVHAVLLLVRAHKSRLVDYAQISSWRGHDETKMEIPDYAYDMHNSKGIKMGRGIDHFFKEGSRLQNHSVLYNEEEYKKEAFELIKKYPGKLSFAELKKGNMTHLEPKYLPMTIEGE